MNDAIKPERKARRGGNGKAAALADRRPRTRTAGSGEEAEGQLRDLLGALEAVRKGDLTQKMKTRREDIFGELADCYNGMVEILNLFGVEVTRVAKEVGTQGKLGGQAAVPGVAGTWKELTDNVNTLAGNLTSQVRNIAQVSAAIANGDLTQKITVDARGEIAEVKTTVNNMVDNLNRLAGEVSRVAQVAGAEGKLTERARVEGVKGSWKDIVDTLNNLINSIATPVQEVIRLAIALSKGGVSQRVSVQTMGDIKTLADALNKSFDNVGRSFGWRWTVRRRCRGHPVNWPVRRNRSTTPCRRWRRRPSRLRKAQKTSPRNWKAAPRWSATRRIPFGMGR